MSSASCVAINMYVSQCSAGHVVQKILDWRHVLKFVAHPPRILAFTTVRRKLILHGTGANQSSTAAADWGSSDLAHRFGSNAVDFLEELDMHCYKIA